MKPVIYIGAVVFVVTLVTNVVVVAVWPESDVDWAASTIVAAVASVVVTSVLRRAESPR